VNAFTLANYFYTMYPDSNRFIGSGIVNYYQGLFDPSIAGVGAHKISFFK
jgi:hypothetical protein